MSMTSIKLSIVEALFLKPLYISGIRSSLYISASNFCRRTLVQLGETGQNRDGSDITNLWELSIVHTHGENATNLQVVWNLASVCQILEGLSYLLAN